MIIGNMLYRILKIKINFDKIFIESAKIIKYSIPINKQLFNIILI